MMKDDSKIEMTGKKVVQAILFHLVDENWFTKVPEGLIKWLYDSIPQRKRYHFNRYIWANSVHTGTQRLLWLMTAAQLDPYILCKWATGDIATTMHRRFGNILESWKP